jgi:hypothetical protein
MIGIGLVLWCWTLFLILKGHRLVILKKCIAATKAQKINLIQVLEGAANPCSISKYCRLGAEPSRFSYSSTN